MAWHGMARHIMGLSECVVSGQPRQGPDRGARVLPGGEGKEGAGGQPDALCAVGALGPAGTTARSGAGGLLLVAAVVQK